MEKMKSDIPPFLRVPLETEIGKFIRLMWSKKDMPPLVRKHDVLMAVYVLSQFLTISFHFERFTMT